MKNIFYAFLAFKLLIKNKCRWLGAICLTIGCSFGAVAADADYSELNYTVYSKNSNVGNGTPGVYFRPNLSWSNISTGSGSDISILRFPLETILKGGMIRSSLGTCQLTDFAKTINQVTNSILSGSGYTKVKSISGDWNGDGLLDLFFFARAHERVLIGFPYTPEWCGFQLLNRGPTTKPDLKSYENVNYNDLDPYRFENASKLEVKDINNDGKDDLIIFYNDNTSVSHLANNNGELFGTGSVSSVYVPPTTLLDDELPEADTLPRVVGATGGSHTIGVDGSANYSIPIAVPNAVADMQPNLSLNYSSAGGNGSLGFGWSLSGQSKISRCTKTQKQDGINGTVDFSSDGTTGLPNDELCLDGQRLVLYSGIHGASGSEYRLENELMIKVVAQGSSGTMPASFSVYAPDGSISSYATVIAATAPNQTEALEWAITTVTDRYGTYRTYEYHQDTLKGSYRLQKISYGGNGNLPHSHSVELKYSSRPNGFYGYLAGSLLSNPDMLTEITAYDGTQRVRFYSLKYRSASHNNTMYLQSVTECSGAGVCLHPTTFEWSSYSSGFGEAEIWLSKDIAEMSMVSSSAQQQPNETGQHEYYIDINGDAKADRVWRPKNGGSEGIQVALSNGVDGFMQPVNWLANPINANNLDSGISSISNVSLRGVREAFGDMNGDGLPDFIWQPSNENNSIYVALNTGSGFSTPQEWLKGTNSTKLFFSTDTTEAVNNNGLFEAFVDVNGDGKLDKVWRPQGKTDYYAALAKKSGIGFEAPVEAYYAVNGFRSFSYRGQRETYVDVTGDGLPDRVWFPKVGEVALNNEASGQALYVAVNAGNEIVAGVEVWKGFKPASRWLTKSLAGDINTIASNAAREGYADLNSDGVNDRWWVLGQDPDVRLYVALSNGKDEFLEPKIWLQGYSAQGINIASRKFKSSNFMDVNDDGYLDMVWRPSDQTNELYVALSTGSSFMAPRKWLDNSSAGVVLTSSSSAYESFADVDGDGLADRVWIPNDGPNVIVDGVIYKSSGGKIAVSKNLSKRASELVKVTNGLGHETKFSYKPLIDSAVYSKNDPEIDNLSNESHKPKVIDAARVVSSVSTSNGIGGYAKTSYHYAGMRFNTTTKQMLGFAKIAIRNELTGLTDTTIYSQNDTANQTGLILQTYTQYQPDANSPVVRLSDTVNTWDVQVLTNNVISGNKRFIRKLLSTEITKHDLGGTFLYRENNNYTYTPDGKIETQVTVVRDVSNEVLKTTHITNEYLESISGAWIKGLPTKITVVEDSTVAANDGLYDPPAITKISQWNYDATGKLISENIMDGLIAIRKTSYSNFDIYGRPQTVSLGTGSVVRVNTNTYSADGKHSVSGTNALGESLGVNTYWSTGDGFLGGAHPGLARSSTDANGVITRFYYDGFGRPKKTIVAFGTPAETETNIEFLSCKSALTACPSQAIYATKTTISGGTQSWSYIDILGREIRQVSQNGFGNHVYIDKAYDLRGNLEKISDPTFEVSTRVWNTMTYDLRDRLVNSVRGSDGREDTTAYSGLTVTTTINANDPAKSDSRTEIKNALGQIIKVADKSNNILRYVYDSAGQLLETRDPANNRTLITYDTLGQKISMQDPDKGTWSYKYNEFGELLTQTSPRNQTSCIAYDKLGRMIRRVDEYKGSISDAANDCSNSGAGSHASTWSYGAAAPLYGKLITSSLADSNAYSETRAYDSLGRLTTVTKKINGQFYAYTTTYGEYSRPDVLTYPAVSGTPLAVKHTYNNYGLLTYIKDAANDALYYQVNAIDAKGRITAESFGNGVTTQRAFNDAANTSSINTQKGLIKVQDIATAYDRLGNLIKRSDEVMGYSETFEYDALRRLTQVQGDFGSGDLRTQNQSYDVLGNITSKTATGTSVTPVTAINSVGNYNYGSCVNAAKPAQTRPHAVCSITGGASYSYDNNGNNLTGDGRTISYASFDLPTEITRNGQTSRIEYDPDRNRYYREDISATTTTKTVQVDALYEKVTSITGSVTDVEEKHYLGNFAVITIKNRGNPASQRRVSYLHHDHLGSLTAITDSSGALAELHLYDAWGKRTAPNPTTLLSLHSENGWNASPAIAALKSEITNNGFTGHEMFDAVGIIHMNGRIYDPLLGRFLQADPVVQSPADLQTYNRYSYVRNNPLTLTDPSGFSFLGDLWDDIKDVFKKLDPIRLLSKLNEVRKSMWREVGRLFIKVPELQTVVTAVLAYFQFYVAIPYFNAAVAGATTYQSGGTFQDIVKGAAIAYTTSAIASDIGTGVGASHGAIASTAATTAFGAAVSKAQGGSWFDLKSFISGALIGLGTSYALKSFGFQQGSLDNLSAEERKIAISLSECVYDGCTGRGGYSLSGSLNTDANTGFKYGVYINNETGHTIVAFAGTDTGMGFNQLKLDLIADIKQALGMQTDQYDQALAVGKQFAGKNVTFVGHSLGGGLAVAAAGVARGRAITINSAGVSSRYTGRPSEVIAYRNGSDLLNILQSATPAPSAAGKQVYLGNHGLHSVKGACISIGECY